MVRLRHRDDVRRRHAATDPAGAARPPAGARPRARAAHPGTGPGARGRRRCRARHPCARLGPGSSRLPLS
ncbi:MAG: hypothetical protein EOP08_01955, partial [Proteobacteria bacterium]